MEEPTEIKSALLPEETHISGICYFTLKKFQSLSYMLLQRGRVFPNLVSVREQTLLGMAWEKQGNKDFFAPPLTRKGGMGQELESQGVGSGT